MTTELRYAYYPGCSLSSSAKEYDVSVRAAFALLDIELVELDDWSCCGAVHADVENADAGTVLPARNLALAEAQGFDKIVAPCSGCYRNLRRASIRVSASSGVRNTVNEHLRDGLVLSTNVEVLHPVYVILQTLGLPALRAAVTRPLTELRVASYYGCMLTRPKDQFDSPERPTGLDQIVGALGAAAVDYPLKAKCCGGAMAISHSGVTARLTGGILSSAKEAGADVIALACPMCHTALDAYQSKAERAMRRSLDLPVFYFTQLMGLALGLSPSQLGFEHHMVSPRRLLARLGF